MKPTETIDHNATARAKSTSSKWLIYLGLAAIVLATLIAYLPAIRGGFIWDDDQYVSENRLLGNFSGLGKIWSLGRTATSDEHSYLISYTPQYYPLVFSSFWLESRLWGQSNPTGFHVVNVVLHIGNALLVWVICRRLGFAWGFVAGAVFALHPVEVESVAWITERKNVLSSLFYLLAMLSYLRFDESRGKVFYLTSLSCFVFALLSKTVSCTLPAALMLILWLRHRRLSWSDVLRLIPFFAVGALLGMFTAYLEHYKVGAVGSEWEIAFWQRCVIAGRAVFFYAWKLVWPANLVFIYPRWDPVKFSRLGLLWPAAVIALAVVLWSKRETIGRAPLAAGAGFVITLFPALGFFDVYPFRFSFVADHFQYLASIFCISLLVGLGYSLFKRLCRQVSNFLVVRSARVLLSSIVLLFLGYLTYAQAHIYEDVESLWRTTIRRNPGAWMAWINLGRIVHDKGDLEQAIGDYNKAIELNPTVIEAYNNRGVAYRDKRDYERAIRDFDKIIELDPTYIRGYYNRGVIYGHKGDYEQAIRDLDKAIELHRSVRDFSGAIELKPKLAEAYNNRGLAYRGKDDYERAIRDFGKAIELVPTFIGAYCNRGVTHNLKGDYEQAIRDFDKAIELNPKNSQAYTERGAAYSAQGSYEEAIRDFERVIKLNPDSAWACNNLAWILATCPEPRIRDAAEAVRLAERSCDLTDNRVPELLDTLAVAYAELGEFEKAVKTAEKAVQLALDGGKGELAKDIQSRLKLYEEKHPYHE